MNRKSGLERIPTPWDGPNSTCGRRRKVRALGIEGLISAARSPWQKRRSILKSGNYLVWSVTWKDVEDFEAEPSNTGPSLLALGHTRPGQAVIQQWKLTPDVDRPGKSSMELLWSWLRFPIEAGWLRELAAISADFVVRRQTIESPTVIVIEEEFLGQPEPGGADPEPVSMDPDTRMLGLLESRFAVKLLGRVSLAGIRGTTPRLPIWTLRLYDDHDAGGE